MNILAVCGNYPYPGNSLAGIFSERCVAAIRPRCEGIFVLSPRPWVPPLMAALGLRWKAYSTIPRYEIRDDLEVHRPAVVLVPRIGADFFREHGTYYFSRRIAKRLHEAHRLDAILSFDLAEAGPLAWQLGADLGIPAAGWAFGSDVRPSVRSAADNILWRTLSHLDCVFYQSREMLECAAQCAERHDGVLSGERHVVQPHGIPTPPSRPLESDLQSLRHGYRIPDGAIVVLSLGRITRAKGVVELVRAFAIAAGRDSRLHLLMVGEQPGFDHAAEARAMIAAEPRMTDRVTILPACAPEDIWKFYYMADMFAFASHREGCPNSLLEALSTGLATVAFAIPAVQEVDGGTGGLRLIPAFDCDMFAEALLAMASSSDQRHAMGEVGRNIIRSRYNIKANLGVVYDRLQQLVDRRVGAKAVRESHRSSPC
jgi:teichuronic acid biosynthesis glycosyltransferase TuaC